MEDVKLQQQKIIMLCSIGPVQEFIAQARRTRDLWFGSYLLSELSKEAALQLARYGELVFPRLINEYMNIDGFSGSAQGELRVANKLLAIVVTADPQKVAWQVRQSVTNKWLDYAHKAKKLLGSSINQGMWDRQVKDLIEFQAVWVPLSNDNQYRETVARAEQILAARKTLRDFKQHELGNNLFGEKKSSLDSGRESVLYPEKADIYMRYGIGEKEALDAISVVKRLSFHLTKRKDHFPSVCEAAFKPFRKSLMLNDEAHQYVKEYYLTLRSRFKNRLAFEDNDIDRYDFRLFYKSSIEDYIDNYVAEKGLTPMLADEKQEVLSFFKDQLDKLYQKLMIAGVQFTPYYAFLLADGDRMGELLGRMKNVNEHRRLSETLSQFALSAEKIVHNHDGELIYSGGDDIMAYAPLDQCLELSNQLRQAFQLAMEQIVPESNIKPTLSIGIAIVHMREPLEDVRRFAKQAERMAKINKDELSIIYQKRSGGDQMRVSMPFSIDPTEKVLRLQAFYRQYWISAQFGFGLRAIYEQYSRMFGESQWDMPEPQQKLLIWKEIVRIALKKAPFNESKQYIEQQVLPCLKTIYDSSEDGLKQLRMLADLMILAVTLEKAGNDQ
ncbi:type III-B CRISPR-associated protein Cas10/Cmr2 [Paenibacillus sp. 1001270B_150601_E10]|uniref:type III-B CRISPR-associated protein Cas10/Cmr2 n=1 Tax=Paenibacillus sp. 1001270B_150601_E10 TaxID=2787079 RepID=UPI00189F5934|nr:type III-B CRISPR-associated protein Cas10/Cmr2 [Paenibacillus sp. 1001270B_150601_E10]